MFCFLNIRCVISFDTETVFGSVSVSVSSGSGLYECEPTLMSSCVSYVEEVSYFQFELWLLQKEPVHPCSVTAYLLQVSLPQALSQGCLVDVSVNTRIVAHVFVEQLTFVLANVQYSVLIRWRILFAVNRSVAQSVHCN
jgi:hypothetical protein